MLHRHSWMVLVLTLLVNSTTSGQESNLVDFQKDVQPILEKRCLECHGPDDAKNGFRVDEMDDLLAYIEPGDIEASSLWSDYLRTDDEDMLMPPPTAIHSGGLPLAELLVLRTWIDEGAEGEWFTGEEAVETEPDVVGPTSTIGKIWAFQGLFHPASVHFPVALLTVSALFVFLSFFNRATFEPVAYHCLWIGALGAVVACLAGWSYAVYRGYGTGVGFDFENSAIDRHRWAGVFVAVFALLTVPLAVSIRRRGGLGKRVVWLAASCILALGVSLAGYQGGELTYGEDHYRRYFEQLFGTDDQSEMADDSSGADDSGWSAEETQEEDESGESPEPSADDETIDLQDDESLVDQESPSEPRSEEAPGDQPQSDEPQSDDPQSDDPQNDAPRSDDPQSDAPRSDDPQSDDPQSDAPQSDEP